MSQLAQKGLSSCTGCALYLPEGSVHMDSDDRDWQWLEVVQSCGLGLPGQPLSFILTLNFGVCLQMEI